MNPLFYNPGIVQFIFWIFICAAAVQIAYYLFFFLRLARYKAKKSNGQPEPVSIVICAKNEEENLLKNLPGILNQEYFNFQVVVVNHASHDGSADVLEAFKLQYPKLHIVTLEENERNFGGKKLALTLGIKAAIHNRVLLTDADCEVSSRYWIKEMMVSGKNDSDIILGYSPYKYERGFLNKFIRFGSFFTALQYFSYALKNMPYMGVGRNLSYTKETFFAVGGFKKHYSIASGDDDLFINEVATSANTAISVSKDSWILTDPAKNWGEFWSQRRRHLSTSSRYKIKHKLLLILYPVSLLVFFVGFFVLLMLGKLEYVVLSIFALRLFLQLFIFRQSMKHLGQTDLLWLSPILELFDAFYNTAVHSTNLLRKQGKWKT